MLLIMPRNRGSGGPDTLCDIAMIVGPGAMVRFLHENSERDKCSEARTIHWTL
ncbi:hypothetical protein V3C99_011940 [Haemonchus contortus]